MSEIMSSPIDPAVSAAVTDICSLLDNFHKYASVGDFDNYFACFHPNGRFLGTDKTENWLVPDFMSFSRPHFNLGTSAWTFIPLPGTRKCDVFPGGDLGVVFATFDEHLESESFHTTARGTGSVMWDTSSGRWLITQYHLSFPIPNDLAHDMCKKIGNFEKKTEGPIANSATAGDWLEDTPVPSSGSAAGGKKKSSGKKKK